jgi:hypothetical protein
MTQFGKNAESTYAALIGDLVGSKGLPDRAALQKRLQSQFKSLNRQLGRQSLAAPLAFTAGDEFQALLLRPQAGATIAFELADALHPVRITFGLGWGGLSTALGTDVGSLDGPCFHRARAAQETASGQGQWLVASGFGESIDSAVSALFLLMDVIRRGWTDKQAQYVRAARGQIQKEVAGRFGVSPSVISESLQAASFEPLRAGEEAVHELLAEFGKKTELAPDSAKRPKSPPARSRDTGARNREAHR